MGDAHSVSREIGEGPEPAGRARPQLLVGLSASERLEQLTGAAQALERAVTVSDITSVILELGVPALGGYAGVLVGVDGEGLIPLGSTGYPEEATAKFRRLTASDPHPLVEAFRTGDAVHASSPEEIARRWPLVPTLATPTQALICLPLAAGGGTLAVAGVSFDVPKEFKEEDLQFLGALAASCGQALARASAFDQAIESLALLDTFFDAAPVGMAFIDRGGLFRRVNAALAAALGADAGAIVGRSIEGFGQGGLGQLVADRFNDVLDTGEERHGERVSIAMAGGRERVVRVGFYPVVDRQAQVSEVLGVGVVVDDVTEDAERLSFLAAVTDDVAATLDAETACEAVARRSVEWLADAAIVHLVESGTVVRVALAANDDELLGLLDRIRERPDAPISHIPDVIRTGVANRVEMSAGEPMVGLASGDAMAAAMSLRKLSTGSVSMLVAPMSTRGRTIGTITVLRVGGRTFSSADSEVATAVGRRAAMAVDTARLYARQVELADAFQQVLVPPALPDIAGLDLAVRYSAAGDGLSVGGDLYDAVEAPDGSWVLVVGDVCGAGPSAAALTSQVRAAARAEVRHDPSPSAVLRGVAAGLVAWEPDRFCTMAVAHVHPSTAGEPRRVDIALAGHPRPIVVRGGGGVEEVEGDGVILGVTLDDRPSERSITLEPGDALFLYTDGVIESRRGGAEGELDLFGEERLLAALDSVALNAQSASDLAEAVEAAAEAFRSGPPTDDVAIVVARLCS